MSSARSSQIVSMRLRPYFGPHPLLGRCPPLAPCACAAVLFPVRLRGAANSSVMAGTFSLEPCSTSSSCNHQGKRSESSLLEKRLSEDSSRHWRLQKWASMSNADASRTLLERREEKAAAAENPLVFLCTRCRRPLGDSLTWVASQEDTNCILLRSQFGPGPWDRLPA